MSRLVEIDLNPNAKTLKQFGLIAFAGFGLLAALAYFEKLVFAFGLGDMRVAVAAVLASLGILALVFSIVAPRANRLIYVGFSLLAFPIGFVLSYLIMGFLFFFVIGPVAVGLRLFGRDPLHRAPDPDAASYWSKAHSPRDKESYFHQY